MDFIKVIGSETVCNTTPQAYSGNKLIRLFNTTAGTVLVTRKDSGNNTIGTFTMNANSIVAAVKLSTDTLQTNNATTGVLAAPIAFGN
jgi:hypothetical protein